MRKFVIVAVVILSGLATFQSFHMRNAFNRVSLVRVDREPIRAGGLSRMVLKNTASGDADFQLRCYRKLALSGEVTFSEDITLLPTEEKRVNLTPGLTGGNMPPMIAGKICGAFWHGPFGLERLAWRFQRGFGKPVEKFGIEDFSLTGNSLDQRQ